MLKLPYRSLHKMSRKERIKIEPDYINVARDLDKQEIRVLKKE